MTTPATAKPRVTVASVQAELAASQEKVTKLAEGLVDLQLKWEDRHWLNLRGTGLDADVDGLDISTIKAISEDLRTWIIGGLLKQASDLRFQTIYGDGVGFAKYARAKTAFGSPNNLDKLFSVQALGEISRAHDTDGQIAFLVHKRTKEIIRVPLQDMGDPYVDGNDGERIWFIKRSWNRITPTKPTGEDVTYFYATDVCPPELARKRFVRTGQGDADKIPIDRDYTAVIWDVNKQVGWPLGIPNLAAALEWARRYTDFMKDQTKFASALASIAWEAVGPDTDARKKLAAALADQTVAGTATMTPDATLKSLPGSSGVSFDNGRPLASLVAALAGVTTDSLLADSDTSAQASLDPDVRNMASTARAQATAFFKRIGKLLGAPDLEVIWPDLEKESPFREAQMIISAWGTGLYGPEEVRGPLAQRIRLPIEPDSKGPTDTLIPNTKSALKAAQDVLPKPDPAAPAGAKDKVDGKQGQGTGVGKLSDGDNTARDNGEVDG